MPRNYQLKNVLIKLEIKIYNWKRQSRILCIELGPFIKQITDTKVVRAHDVNAVESSSLSCINVYKEQSNNNKMCFRLDTEICRLRYSSVLALDKTKEVMALQYGFSEKNLSTYRFETIL